MDDALENAYLVIMDSRGNQSSQGGAAGAKARLSGQSQGEAGGGDSKTLKVQFNPSELSFSSGYASEKKEKASLERREDGKVPHAPAETEPGKITVQIKLVFDRSIYQDSSVQPEVEGFLNLVKNPYVRQVAFYWGSQYYRGGLKSVEAEYTMFNSQGVPMRANVGLSIELL